jgi:hypothetical protein
VAIRRGLTPSISSGQAHRQALTALLRHGFQVYTLWCWTRGAKGRYTLSITSSDSRLRFTMAIPQRKQTSIILTFRILQFVKQLRRRVQPRMLDGSIDASNLDNRIFPGIRRISKGLSRISIDAKQSRRVANRICKARQRNPKSSRSSFKPGTAPPASRNLAGDEVQQYVHRLLFGFIH